MTTASDMVIHRVKVHFMKPMREWVSQDESRDAGDREVTENFTIVAPERQGKELIELHFKYWMSGHKKLSNGKLFEILEHTSEPINLWLRFSDNRNDQI